MTEWCRVNRHRPVVEQHQALVQKLRGHFGYYGIIGNYEALLRFLHGTKHAWQKWLARRSRRAGMPWDRMTKLLEHYPLPQPRIAQPWRTPA
jgi:hypothetical protein